MPQVAAVVVAAGQGLRAGGDMPKQFREIGGLSLLRRSLLGFAGVPTVTAPTIPSAATVVVSIRMKPPFLFVPDDG